MRATAVPLERDLCVDYACRCRVMYLYVCGSPSICTRMLFISCYFFWFFHEIGQKGASSPSVDTACVLTDHETHTHQTF